MPALSRWLVRAALVYLVLGFGSGGLLLAGKAAGAGGRLWGLLPLHVEWLIVGWMLQLAFGVAFWVLPRAAGERRRAWLGWLALGLVNGGLALAAAARVAALSAGAPAPPWLLAPAAAAQVVGAVAFAAHLWPRARPLVLPGSTPEDG